MNIELVTALMFASLIALMLTGLPIAFCLAAVGMIFGMLLWGPAALNLVNTNLFGFMTEFILVAIPLFVFMASMLQYSGIAENLFEVMYRWSGRLRGGLAMGSVGMCAVIAAMSGLSATGTLGMGVVAIPAMLKRKYHKDIALGSIAAGGALGALIPPSVPMVVYSFLTHLSVGRMFLGGILPGFLLVVLYIGYIGIRAYISPDLCPALAPEERASWTEKIKSLRLVILPIVLIIAVLGSIFAGIATPTEAAAVGALGSIVCAAINRKVTWENLRKSGYETLRLSAMLMWIMAAASIFSSVYTGLGAPQLIRDIAKTFVANRWLIVIGMQVVVFLLGCILDGNSIMLITIPIFAPIVVGLGFAPLWFGILFIMNLETSYLTPPFGWNIFYIKSIVPESVSLMDIYRAVGAFVGLQVLGLALVMLFPQIALVVPDLVMGKE